VIPMPMKKRTPTTGAVLLVMALLPALAAAADPEIILGTEKVAWERIDIRVQAPLVFSGGEEAQRAAELVDAVVRDDLHYSGLFNVLRAAAPGEAQADSLQASFGIEGTLEGRPPGTAVTADEAAPVLSLKLLSYPERQLLLGKRYRPTADQLRVSAHHFVNEVVQFLTMEPGICLTRIVFSRGSGDRRDLWCVDYDGENLTRLTANRTLNLFPAWSPEGDRVAFMSYRDGQQGTYMLDVHNGRVILVGETPGSNLGPGWHPNGRELLLSLSKSGQHEIYRMDLRGKSQRRLTVSPAIEVSPDWSPNGRDVVFTSDRTGTPQLYIMDADGSGRRRLTFEGRYNDAAAWSPSGEQIVYAWREEDLTQLVLMNATGEDRRVLTEPSWRNCEDPRWAPDGRHVVFASDRTGVFKLYVLDVIEGTARQLTHGDEPDTTPDWSP